MNSAEIILTITTSVMGVILIPTLVLAFRLAVRWKGIEDNLTQVTEDVRELIADKNKVHAELYSQMREDRDATNKRLRWLEENLWNTRRAR